MDKTAEMLDEATTAEPGPHSEGSQGGTGVPSESPPVWRRAWVVLALFAVALSAWAFASPIGASPDEDYHLASIWCAQGDRDLACDVTEGGTIHAIPAAVRHAVCFAFNEDVSAGCQTTTNVTEGETFVVTDRGNFGIHAGEYPGLFYSTMSLFVGPDVELSVIMMRLTNVAIAVLVLGATFVLSAARVRRAIGVTVAITIVPLGLFIVPSINPSSWAVLSAYTLFFAVFGFLTATDRARLVGLGAVSVLGLVLGAGSRADASIYAVVAIGGATVVALAAQWRPSRGLLVRLVLPVILTIAAGVSYLDAGQSASVGDGAGRGPSEFFFTGLHTLRLWVGALGQSPLGWLDTPMPSLVWVPTTAIFFAALFVWVSRPGILRVIVVVGVAFAAVALPTYIEATAVQQEGSVQARYIYPLLIVLVATATLTTERRDVALTTVQRWIVVLGLSGAASVALYENLRRYVTGTDVRRLRLAPGEWWWSGVPFSSEVVWIVGTVAFCAALVLVSRLFVRLEPLELPSELGAPEARHSS